MMTFILIVLTLIVGGGCVNDETGVGRRATAYFSDEPTPTPEPTATPEVTPTPIPLILSSEIRHFVDPYSGDYKPKITIPKNYHGFLYLSGLNITALSDRIIKVRFRFGTELASIDIPATIAQGTGMTPQTTIQVLVLDMRERPFENIRLRYDLFDYNTYDSNSSPTQDPYNDNVFCRALTLDYDPTFESDKNKCNNYASGACPYSLSDCDYPSDKCFYAFAKIRDSGLYDGDGYPVIPSEPHVDRNSGDFLTTETDETQLDARNEENLKKCLPDNGDVLYRKVGGNNFLHMIYQKNASSLVSSISQEILTRTIDGQYVRYKYMGPYRLLSENSWAIKKGASVGPNGLFADTIDGDTSKVNQGINSFLFPRATKLDLPANVDHLSSLKAWVAKSDVRTLRPLLDSGKSSWMDGCNWRVMNYDALRNEGGSSCNATASVELITTDSETGAEIILHSSKEVKLQLIRPSETNDEGEEVLHQSMKTCTSSRTCGANECCFNQRCWSKSLIGQCIEDATTEGQQEVGSLCSSDYECLTLCCDSSLGRCATHNTSLSEEVLCSKPPGTYCVAKEWCRKDVIRDCRVVKTGISPTGKVTCTLRCYNTLQNGSCVNGQCVAPSNPPIPPFDATNPDCSKAQDPPLILL